MNICLFTWRNVLKNFELYGGYDMFSGKVFLPPLQHHFESDAEMKSSSVQVLRLCVQMKKSMFAWVHDCMDTIGYIEAELYRNFEDAFQYADDVEKDDDDDVGTVAGSRLFRQPSGAVDSRAAVSATLLSSLSVNECEQCRTVMRGLSGARLCAIPEDFVQQFLHEQTLGDLLECLRVAQERVDQELDDMILLVSEKEEKIERDVQKVRQDMEQGRSGW